MQHVKRQSGSLYRLGKKRLLLIASDKLLSARSG
jgi:hypothetical protein